MRPVRLDLTTGEPFRHKPCASVTYTSKYRLEPIDLDDLMERADPMADAAKSEVEWGAISFWLSGGYETSLPAIAAADIPDRVAKLSVHLVQQAQRHETGWPILSGIIVTPALYGYSPNAQCEVRQVAADVYLVWEQAGRPHIDASRCRQAFQYLTSAVRRGLIDPLPGIKKPETIDREVRPGSAADMQQTFLASF